MTRFSRRSFLLTGSATLASSVLLKACASPSTSPDTTASPGPAPASPAGGEFKVAIILPGVITDKAWNQAGYEGLNEIKKKQGAEIAYVEKIG